MNSTETIPQVWDDERDGQFFRLTASLFSPAHCYGASVLLASYDDDSVPSITASCDRLAARSQTAAAAVSVVRQ